MQLRRTANAGVLLKLDGVSILMDGVCREEYPYPATPPEIKAELTAKVPDAVAFTHAHNDHYDPDFAKAYLAAANGVIIGPEDLNGNKRTMRKMNTIGGWNEWLVMPCIWSCFVQVKLIIARMHF